MENNDNIEGMRTVPGAGDGTDLVDANEQEQSKAEGFNDNDEIPAADIVKCEENVPDISANTVPRAQTVAEDRTIYCAATDQKKPESTDEPPVEIPASPEKKEEIKEAPAEIPQRSVQPEVPEQKPEIEPAETGNPDVAGMPRDGELPVKAEKSDLPQLPKYHWNYDRQLESDRKKDEKKKKNGALSYAIIMTVAFVACFCILITILVNGEYFLNTDSVQGTAQTGDSSENVNNYPDAAGKVVYVREYDSESGVLTTPELYEKCLPSVVSVYCESATSKGIGSGFIVSDDGYIATANHVVSGMTDISVILSDKKEYKATVAGGNEFTDIALLKIEASNLPAVTFGKSSELLNGEKVVAIGTPADLGFSGSVTSGEVSYNGRIMYIYNESTKVLEKKMKVIQTNALVNPGNSGCPLFDEHGRVVGIITMKLSDKYVGMGFAIPSDGALPILNAMKSGTELTDEMLSAVSVRPAKLGISGSPASVNGVYGVKVTGFTDSKYDAATKLKADDLIVGIGSSVVTSNNDIISALLGYNPGDVIPVTVYRGGQRLTLKVNLGS